MFICRQLSSFIFHSVLPVGVSYSLILSVFKEEHPTSGWTKCAEILTDFFSRIISSPVFNVCSRISFFVVLLGTLNTGVSSKFIFKWAKLSSINYHSGAQIRHSSSSRIFRFRMNVHFFKSIVDLFSNIFVNSKH